MSDKQSQEATSVEVASGETKLARIAEVMRMVAADCKSDAMMLDRRPFDGRTVGEQFGNILAAVKAVATAVEVLASTTGRGDQAAPPKDVSSGGSDGTGKEPSDG